MSKKISADSDLHSTSSPPTSLSHVGDKHGTHYASDGDITSLSRPDSSESSGSSNQEALNHTASQMDPSSQGFQHGMDIDSSAHSDPTLRVHADSTAHEDTGKFEDTSDKEFHQLFCDNEFRDGKTIAASKNDCDKSPRKISFGADSVIPDRSENDSVQFTSVIPDRSENDYVQFTPVIPDRLENDSVQFTPVDEAVLLTMPVVEEGKKIKKTYNMDATLAFKNSSHITQLTNDSDDEGLKHQDRIVDAGIHMKEMVESSGSDDFSVSDVNGLVYTISESQPQAINAKNGASTSPLVTNAVSSSSSEEKNNIKADIGTENLVYNSDGKLMSTFSQRCSSEIPKPVQHFKGESPQCHTSYTMETPGKESPSGDAMSLATLRGVHSADAALTTTADDSSTTISNLSALHSKDLVCTVDAKMIYSSKKALSVRFSDDVMEIPPSDEFPIGLNDSHENVFPAGDSDLNSLNIGTRPVIDFSLDSVTDGTSITNSLNGLKVTGSVEMMKLHKEKMNGKNDMFLSELSLQDDPYYQICEEREFKNIGEDSHLSSLPALDNHLLSDSDKTFQQDYVQIELSSFITPHQSTGSAELQNSEDYLSGEPIEAKLSHEIIQIVNNDMMELKPSVNEADVDTTSFDQQIESRGTGHKLDHSIPIGEQSIKIEQTVETCWQPHQGSTEDLASQIEIEETIERLNRPENHKGFEEQSVEHVQVLEQPVVSIESLALSSEFETSMNKDLTYQTVEKRLKDLGEGSQSHLLSALKSHSVSYRGENLEPVSQTEQFSLVDPYISTDSVKSYQMNTADQQSKEEQHTNNDLIELKPNIEEMDGKSKSPNNLKESQGDSKLDLPIQGRNGDQSMKKEDMGEIYLQSHESGTEDSFVSTELGHTIQRINMHEKHEGFGKELVEHEQVLAQLALNPCIESTGQSESLYQEDQVCQGVEERQLKDIGECSHSCLLPALDSHSLSHLGKICDLDFQIEQSLFLTTHQYTDSAEYPSVKVTDIQSKVEDKEDAVDKSIETHINYALAEPASNDMMEFKLPIEGAEKNTKILDHQIELQGDGHKFDLSIHIGADEQSINTEERDKTCLQVHSSSDENLTGSTELEHNIESSNIHDSHEVSGMEPFENDNSVLNPRFESAKKSGQHIFQANEAEFELSFDEEENSQNVDERGFMGTGDGSHSCLLPVLDIYSDGKKGASSEVIEDTSNDVIEGTINDVIEGTSNDVIAGTSSEVIEGTSNDVIEGASNNVIEVASSEVIEGTSNDVIEGANNEVIKGTSNDIIELKSPITEAVEKHKHIDYQIESQVASPKLHHLIHGGTGELFIKTEETGEKHLQSLESSSEEFASHRDIEHIELLYRHENHERLGEQFIVHDPVLQNTVGKICTEIIGQEAQSSESLRNGPPPILELFMSLHEAAVKEPMLCPVDAVDDSACLRKITAIDQLQEDGGTPLLCPVDAVDDSACLRKITVIDQLQEDRGTPLLCPVDAVDDSACLRKITAIDQLQEDRGTPLLCPVDAVDDFACLRKVTLIDQLEEDGGTPMKNVQDSDTLSSSTSDLKVASAKSEDFFSIRQLSLPSLIPSDNEHSNVSLFDDKIEGAEIEDCHDPNRGKHDEEQSVPLIMTCKKDISQPKINIRMLEEDLEPTLDISHFPGLKIKPRTRKHNVGPAGTGFLGPQDSLQKVIPPFQLLKMKQRKIVENISSKAASNSPTERPANQKQNEIGTIKDFQSSNNYKEMEKVNSHKVKQSVETTLYSESEGNAAQDAKNGENTNAIQEVPDSSPVDGKDSCQQWQTKPSSLLDEAENVNECGNSDKRSLSQVKIASTQTEGNIHQTSVKQEGNIDALYDSVETIISKKEEGSKSSPYVIMSQDFDMSTSNSGSESMEKAVEPSVYKDTKMIITGLTVTPCEGNTVDKKTNIILHEARKPLREDSLGRKTNDQKRDIAGDTSGKTGNSSDESNENNQSDCTMSSRLPEIYHKKDIEMELLEDSKGHDNTTNHPHLIGSDSLEMRGTANKPYGYVEVYNKFPSDLLPRGMERTESENISANDFKLTYTAPKSLVDKVTQYEEMAIQSPRYGEFQYSAPSNLLQSVKKKSQTEENSPVYCELYTTPPGLFDKHIQSRNISSQSPGYGDPLYTTPADLFYRIMERNESENGPQGYGELMYTTPSRLLERQIQNEKVFSDQSPVYGESQYTTPSSILHIVKGGKSDENRSPGNGELLVKAPSRFLDKHKRDMADQLPMLGEFQYKIPSGVLLRERNEVEDLSPGHRERLCKTSCMLVDKSTQSDEEHDQATRYEEVVYKLPWHRFSDRKESQDRSEDRSENKQASFSRLSDMDRKQRKIPDNSPCYGGENRFSGYCELPYSTPSRLLERHIQREEMPDNSPGYGEFQYTTPSRLLHRAVERNEGENRSPGYGELSYTTPSRLLERHIQREEITDNSPGYGEFHYTTPSRLLHRAVERNEGENRSSGYGELSYTTPSRLLERHIQREEMADNSPGYGEFQYTTPSGLLHRAVERNEGKNRSPGYGELSYTTPSRLLERHIQREEMPDNSPGYGEFQYTSPSGLLHRAMERNEGENRSPGYGELSYTTPSRLLERHIQREEMADNSPGYGEFHYTTPSGLLHRAVERNEGENRSPGYGELSYTTPSRLLERHIQREEMADNSPGYGEFLYTTPSGLVQRIKILNEGENRSPVDGELKHTAYNRLLDRSTQSDNMSDQSPGYGEFQYRIPTDLLCSIIDRKGSSDENKHKASTFLVDLDMKGREIPNYSQHFEESLDTTPTKQRDDAQQASEVISPRYRKFGYVTNSVLNDKDTKREDGKEKSQLSGKFQNKTPSELVAVERRKGEKDDDKSSRNNPLRFSTPSLLLYQELLRRLNLDASSPGYRVPKSTLIKAKSRTEDEGYGNQEYATPSQILEKYNRRTYASQSSPCLEYHYSASPSQMLVRSFDQKKPENVTQGYELPSNVSPSELFTRIHALENGRSQLLENDLFKGLRYASEPQQIQMYRPYGIEYPMSDRDYRYSAPSRLLEVMEQRPAELVTGRASSSRHQHPRDQNKYNEQNVQTEYKSPARFVQKREDQVQRPKAPDYVAFHSSIPLRLIELDDTTRPSPLPGVLRDSDLEVQEEEAILYQYEYDKLVAADRNTSTGLYYMSDNKKPATVQYPPSLKKLYNEVYPAIPYPSTTAVQEFQYKTPVDVLHSVKEKNGGEDKSPGYGKYLYTTPYRLLDGSTQTEIIFDQSPMFQHGLPSGLLFRVSDGNAGKDRSPSTGSIKHNGSAKVFDMDRKTIEVTDHLPHFDEAVYTAPSGIMHREDANKAFVQISPRYAKFCDVTPSALLHTKSTGQDQNSYQLANFQYKMPSQLLAVEKKLGEIEDKSQGQRSIRYSTPSLLLYQELLSRQNSDVSFPGYVVPIQDTLTKVKSITEDERYAYPKNTTPSPILEKSSKAAYESQSSPHFEYHFSRIPSQMLAKNTVQEMPENVTHGHELPDNASPSELFNRIQALENGRSKPSEGAFDQYLRTPNRPLQMYRPNETEHHDSDGEYRYSASSRLLEVMEQRSAELVTGKASSSRHQHQRDQNKYNEQNVKTEYRSPARFDQKKEDQVQRPKAPDYKAFIDSTPLRIIELDNTTRLGQKSSSSAVSSDLDLEGQEREAILYQHEYDNFVAADRNGNANNNIDVESSVDPDCGWSLASIQRDSVANSQQLQSNVPAAVQRTLTQSNVPAAVQHTLTQSNVPAAVQHTLTQSNVPAAVQRTLTQNFNKSDSEVPPTTQKLSRSNFKRSECTAASTNQQASSESFSKLENEVEHAEIIRRLMVVLGNTAVFLAAYTEHEIISLLTFMKKGQEPAGSPIQRDGHGSVAPFLGNHEVQGPHHVAWMTSARTLKVLKASLTSESEADLYQVLVDIQSLLSCANSFLKEHGNISIDALIRSESDYHRSFGKMDVTDGARGMSEPYRWFFSEEFVQTTTLQEFLNMIQNTPQMESSHIVLKTKPFRNVNGGDVNSIEVTVPFQDSVHIQELFSGPVHQPRTHTSDVQFKHLQLPQKMDRTVSPWDISNTSQIPSQTRNSVIWQNKDGSFSQSVSDFPDFSPKTLHSKKGSAFSLVINPSFNLSSDDEDLDTERKWDTAKGQIMNRPEIKKNKTSKRLIKQSADKDMSPDRGQRLYGSSLGLNWQSDGKKGKGRPGASPDARSFMMEKELLSSQNRKLQGEINTLQTENTLLKEKYNRVRARIAEIEKDMQATQSELDKLLETSNQEITELTISSRLANQKDRQQFENKILGLAKENESFKLETASLQKQVESSKKLLETIRQAGEKSKLLEAQKAELIAVNEQLGNMKEHLDQREQHFLKEEGQHIDTKEQVQKLTKITSFLQQQPGATDDEAVIDKQIQSMEKRLKVTEERLFQERADRANNLSQVEEKLLAENAQFQVIENDLSRKLQREKEKNRNLEKNIKDLREEIEKLHLALPFDESLLTLKKGNYSIPSNSHSSQRAESLRSNDMNYIMAQIEKEDGLGAGQEQDIIRELWNKRKLAIIQLHELEIQLVELGISDNIAEGLKNLRDNYGQAETKLKQMEEKLSDMQFEMAALENTYKQQLTTLVHERHDAFAHLKTAEDLLEALKIENQSLKLSLSGSQSTMAHQNGGTAGKNAETEQLKSRVQSLEGQLGQVISRNKLMEGELKMVNVQLNSRDQALQESKEELELLYTSLTDNETSKSQQLTIDRLSEQVNHLNTEIGMLNDRNNTLLSEKEKLEDKLAVARKKEISLQKLEQQQKANNVQIEDLREELNEKDHKTENLKWQLHELDSQLQKVRQDLYMEQENKDELEAEVESLQQTVTQRAQMFETLVGSEQEQLAQFQLLKDTLDSMSKELDQKKTKVITLELDLSLSKNRVEELERDLKELRHERSYDTKFHPPTQSAMGDRLRIRELVGERTTLKQEIEQLQSTVQLTKEQASQGQKELLRLESELVKAKTTILQLTAEKHELEKLLERTAEENDSLVQEWGQAEEDLVKLEKKLQEILEKFEQEARKQHGNFETRYLNIPSDYRKLLNELDSLRLLLKGKEREAEMIKDRSMRQQMEVKFLQKKVELIQNQMVSNREDIDRMVNQLATKMKEAVRTREINQFLAHERTKLKTENYHLEKDLEKERDTNVQMKKEIEEITQKIEMSQVQSKNTVKEAQDKDNLIATIEADLRNATRNLTHLEIEVSQQKNKIERLNNDVKNLTNINSTLENRLETEKNTLAEEKETSRRMKDDLTNMGHKLEMLQHEHQLTLDKLATEQQTVETLRNQSQSYHEECELLKEEVTAHKNHVDILRGQVLLGKDDLDKLKQEKESLKHEYEVLCRQLNVKEHELKLHREESLHKLDTLQKELHEEKTTLENNQTQVQKELDFTRSELESLKEKLQHKEIQLQSFVRTLQELEVVTREKRELEANVERLEGLVRDNKIILEGQRKEIMTHLETNAKHQEMLAKAEVTNQKLYGELRIIQENSQHEIHGLQITIKELQSQHEAERTALSESLSQSHSQLQSSQSHLAIAADSRDKLQARVRILERDLEEIKSKLSDESTGRHLTEHSVGSLRLQLEDTRNQKIVAEARLIEMEKALAKTESQLKTEKEKLKKLSGRFQEAEFSNHSTESSVKAKQEQVDLLQNENIKLRQMLESQKQSLISKMKMTSTDIKQQLEMVQNERDKMSSQMQKLSIDLDQSREQIALKNKENYKQQEVILALEDQLKECKLKLKVAEDSLKTETAVQDQLTHRYAEQEDELKVLKNFLAKKAEESSDADKTMWHEMNNVIQELSRQMHSHLESQKQNKDARESPTHIQKLKRQITDLQSELSTERSLHQITRDSLQALEEDCKRLRHQLHVLRRRESSASDKKYKNRMEAINAIIAKSQSQAQALLASGGYHDDINSPRPDFNIYSPRMGYNSPSPRMGYSSPQRAFSPDNSVTSEFSIASTGPMVPTFESSVPYKTQGRRN